MKIHLLPRQLVIGSRRYLLTALVSFAALTSLSSFAHAQANGDSSPNDSDARIEQSIRQESERLNSEDAEVRRDAVLRLGWIQRPQSSRAAVRALMDPAEFVRAAATQAILSLPPDEALTVLLPVLNDKKPFVRQEAAFAMGKGHLTAAVPTLINLMQTDQYLHVRAAAAVALGQIGDVSAVDALAAALKGVAEGKIRDKERTEFEFLRRSAAEGLGLIGSPAAVPALIDALGRATEPDDVRRECARALGLIADPSSGPALQAVLQDRDPYLSRLAQDALVRINKNKN